MAEINGYIKGLQYYFVSTPYDKRKVANVFCEKYGATNEEWEAALRIGDLYVECNLVQDMHEATLGSVKYKSTYLMYILPAVRVQGTYVDSAGDVQTYNNTHSDSTLFANNWAPSACKENAPIYRFNLVSNTNIYQDQWNIEILPVKEQGLYPVFGDAIKTFSGWGGYPDDKEYNDLDEQVDTALEQQGKGVLASFVRYAKRAFKSLSDSIKNLSNNVSENYFRLIGSSGYQTLGHPTMGASNSAQSIGIQRGMSTDKKKYRGLIINGHGITFGTTEKEYYPQQGALQWKIVQWGRNNISNKEFYGVYIDPSQAVSGGEATSASNILNGVYIKGKSANDLLTAVGTTYDKSSLITKTSYASTTNYGVVKMAGKVDALSDNATTAQVADRLNTLIAYLKSAGLMSEN